ncbi:MAG: LruC domain-containing protein [Bacteroidaceae bacterium]|nr:LruC domain-containing protein [Bacteroidaceae bacterium]
MKKILKSAMLVALTAAGFTACSSEFDPGVYTPGDKQREEFAKGFEDVFGKVNPNQDWNLAEQATVGVSGLQGNSVQVYAKVGGKYILVGDYAKVSNTEELKVDVPKGVNDLLLISGNQTQKVKVGGSVSFASQTRAGSYGEKGNGIVISATDQKIEMTKADAQKFTTILPESESSDQSYSNTNLSKVTQDFKFVSNGEFVIFPTYWNTGNTDELGLYYLDDYAQMVRVPIYTIKSGSELQYVDANNNYYDISSNDAAASFGWGVPAVKLVSTGIKVTIPKGTVFGMYVKPSNAECKYSESKYNEASSYSELTNNCYGSTFTLDGEMYLGFEDWEGGNNFDMNDMMFRFRGNVPTTVDESGISWDVACEDLGDLYDYDFNDVVFNVQHISGRNTVTVTPLAAGGQLQAWLYNSYKTTDGGLIGDTHKLLNGAAPAILNANGIVTAGEKVTFELTGDAVNNFTMAYNPGSTIESGNSDNSTDNMGGFYIKVRRGESDVITVNGPRQGSAPQMILVPAGWDWPTEGTRIDACYEDFGKWGAGYYTNLTWYNNQNAGASVVKSPVQKVISSDSENPSGIERTLTSVWVADALSNPLSQVYLEKGSDAVTYSLKSNRPADKETEYSVTVKSPESIDGILSYTFNATTNKLTVTPGSTTGTVVFEITEAASTEYYGGKSEFTVIVEEPKTPSEFSVSSNFLSSNTLNLTTTSGVETITIKSKSNVTPTISGGGNYFTLGTLTQTGWGSDEGWYSWTVTVTQTGEGSGSYFTVSQVSNETYKGGSATITVNVVDRSIYTYNYSERIQSTGWGNEVTIDLSGEQEFLTALENATSAKLFATGTAADVYPNNNTCFEKTNLVNGSLSLSLDLDKLKASKTIVIGTDNGYIENVKVKLYNE